LITLAEAKALATAPERTGRRAAAAQSLLHGVLFVTILVSPFVFIEPSPYEAMTAALGFACLLARVTLDRKLLPLVFLLLIWTLSGAVALMPVIEAEQRTVTYTAITLYLSLNAVVFACLFAHDSVRRLAIMRAAYVIAAVIVALIGTGAYFGLLPYSDTLLAFGDRARATFKDPNVFGPFLVLPMLFTIQSILSRGPRVRFVLTLGALAAGLLCSFSRGAWLNFAIAVVTMIGLMFVTAPDLRSRMRLVVLSGFSVLALLGFLAVMLSIGSIDQMLAERAKVTQSYDVGSGGRFTLQEIAAGAVFDNPLGMGPYEFARIHGLQQHNVYLQAFLVYGWLGAFAYITLLVLTLALGLRMAMIATPWQPYLIAAYSAFLATVIEGFVIDSDHWRHFFLLLGIIWGLSIATMNAQQRSSAWRPLTRGAP
jgi:O-antigen ligase